MSSNLIVPLGRRLQRGDAAHQGRLACAVGPRRPNIPLGDCERCILEGARAVRVDVGDALEREHRVLDRLILLAAELRHSLGAAQGECRSKSTLESRPPLRLRGAPIFIKSPKWRRSARSSSATCPWVSGFNRVRNHRGRRAPLQPGENLRRYARTLWHHMFAAALWACSSNGSNSGGEAPSGSSDGGGTSEQDAAEASSSGGEDATTASDASSVAPPDGGSVYYDQVAPTPPAAWTS